MFRGVALIGAAAVLYVIAQGFIKPDGALRALARGDMIKLRVSSNRQPPPLTPILDAKGRRVRLADFKGKVLVVNLWATWCPPCVREMPSLARLQAAYAGRLVIAPISMDSPADQEKARAFMAKHPPLPFYQDPKFALGFALKPPAEGYPTTVIYDHTGLERARVEGPAEWSSRDAHRVFDLLLKER